VTLSQGRTVLAETVGGEPVVVKWFPGQQEPLAEKVRACEVLRRRGYPAARTLAYGRRCERSCRHMQQESK
jgi:hypothetical protein